MKLLLKLPAAVAVVAQRMMEEGDYGGAAVAIRTQRMMEEDDYGGEGSWHSSHFSSQKFLWV